jgi:uncharacterized membrane protein YkvA (DUF1232 family)
VSSMIHAADFTQALRDAVRDYRGSRERAIHRAGDVFDFYSNLFADSRLTSDSRVLINAVLAYFVVGRDIIPEEVYGPIGYIDDLYVASYAFRILRRELPGNLLVDAWRADDDLDEVMGVVFRESRSEVGKQSREILGLAGFQ